MQSSAKCLFVYFKNCYRPADLKTDEAGGVSQCTALSFGLYFDVRRFGRLAGKFFHCKSVSEQLAAKRSRLMWSEANPGQGRVCWLQELVFQQPQLCCSAGRNSSVCTLCTRVSWSQPRRFRFVAVEVQQSCYFRAAHVGFGCQIAVNFQKEPVKCTNLSGITRNLGLQDS